LPLSMTAERQRLQTTIRRTRRRFKSIASIRGLAWWLGLSLMVVAVAVVGVDYWNYSRKALLLARWTSLLVIGLSLAWLVVRPLARRVSDFQIARTIEEHHPQLQDRLVTAVELDSRKDRNVQRHPFLSLLLRDAAHQSRFVKPSEIFNRKEPLQSALIGSGLVLLFVLLQLHGPHYFQFATLKLYADQWWPQAARLYRIQVSPGDARVRKGSDQTVTARLEGFEAEPVQLFFRDPRSGSWKSRPMTAESGANRFEFSFVDIGEPIRYYVQASNIRSDAYELSVLETARVRQIDLTYRFPSYTGLPRRTERNGGDIDALRGTRVEVKAHLNLEPVSARILLGDGTSIPMHKEEGPAVSGEIKVSGDSTYRIQLTEDWTGEKVESHAYAISAIRDQPPQVAWTRPGRDRQATALEEVLTEAKADDDFGLRNLELHYALNGARPAKIDLFKPSGGGLPRSISATHTFFLEEFELQPGDFVSYFARASDALSTTTSDIYFLEVRPFGKQYQQSQSGARRGGGSSNPDSLLSRRQKQILVATWGLIRDRKRLEKKEFRSSLRLLGELQLKLQQRTQSLADRVERRALTGLDPDIQKFSENLVQAVQAMVPAHQSLSRRDPDEAVPHQQRALQSLMRAETFYKKVQVARGGAQGRRTWAQELESLFELELDKLKNQYEVQQQAGSSDSRRQMDEATRKLRELARRQQQINQDQRRRMLEGASRQTGGADGSRQGMLQAEAEKLARRLERLSREMERPSLREVSQRLHQAAREMRKLRGAGGSQAENRGLQALSRIREAGSALDRQRRTDLDSELSRLRSQARDLVQRQRHIRSELEDLKAGVAREDPIEPLLEQRRRMLRDKTSLQQALREMEGRLFSTAKGADLQQPEASRRLRAAGQSIRNRGLHEQMDQSRQFLQLGLLDLAAQDEQRIQTALSDLRDQVAEAGEAARKGPAKPSAEERLSRALTQAGDLLSNLESLKRRIADLQARSGAEQPAGPSGPGSRKSAEPNRPQGLRRQSQTGRSAAAENPEQRRSGRGRGQAAVNFGDRELPPPTTLTPRQARQFEKEFQHRLGEARDLRRSLARDADLAAQVRNMVKRMEQMKSLHFLADPQELERLRRNVIEGLRQLEFDLGRKVRQLEGSDSIHLVKDEDAPSRYRKQVEDYYKALAR